MNKAIQLLFLEDSGTIIGWVNMSSDHEDVYSLRHMWPGCAFLNLERDSLKNWQGYLFHDIEFPLQGLSQDVKMENLRQDSP